MLTPLSLAEDRRARAPHRFALPLLGVSLLLHLAAYQWAEGRLAFPSLRESKPDTITTVMLPPPAARPAKPAKPKVRRKQPAARPPAPLHETTSAAPAAVAQASDDSSESSADIIAAAASAAEADLPVAQATETEITRYTVNPPPSAQLQYDVQALNKGQNWHGTGVYSWELSGNSYNIAVAASIRIIFKIDVLNATSQGTINEFGLMPLLYSEKRPNKSMTNTHFRHHERLISFSASEATYPYQDGAQDRASFIWQLAAIGRGDRSQFVPGSDIDIFVAERRDAGIWQIQVIGEEEVDTPHQKLMAWHLRRAPRAGSYDQRIDIWLAPEREWYPVKVRYTEANGDYTELLLSDIVTATAN